MDSNFFHRSSRSIAFLLLAGLVTSSHGCRSRQPGHHPPIFDPTMQFEVPETISPPYQHKISSVGPLPPGSFHLHVDSSSEPGFDARANQLQSYAQVGIGLFDMLGLEAGFGYEIDNQFVARKDGISQHFKVTHHASAPQIGVVMDDGVSIMRLGYRYLSTWDTTLHEPKFDIKTNILGDDTTLEIGYRHNRIRLQIPLSRMPAAGPIDEVNQLDDFRLAIEQSLTSDWRIRVDLAGRIEQGFLQNPYRSVTLWPLAPDTPPDADPPTRLEAEKHPSNRVRWGGKLQIQRWVDAISSALELGIGHGSGSWGVDHSAASVRYLLRIADPFTISIAAGIYHQTRADFYRDAYWSGPVKSNWSADRDLSSFLAKSFQFGFLWTNFFGSDPLLGLLKRVSMRCTGRIIQSDFNWSGAGDNHAFTDLPFTPNQELRGYEAGLVIQFGLAVEGGF